jgi:hypothetical protein
MVGRVIRAVFGALVLSSIAAGIAALVVKRHTTSIGTPEGDEIALTAIFEPLVFKSTASAFRGGTLLCLYGGADLDLSGATLDRDGAYLTIRVIFGGGRLIVPDEWQVELDVTAILGGAGDARPLRARDADAPRLVIHGLVAMGGISIVSAATARTLDAPTDEPVKLEPELVAALEV